jgi:hypothetical protein
MLPTILVFLPATFLAQDFAGRVYPVLEKAQCRTCHNDNGVASDSGPVPREQLAEEVEDLDSACELWLDGQPDASFCF